MADYGRRIEFGARQSFELHGVSEKSVARAFMESGWFADAPAALGAQSLAKVEVACQISEKR
jgi:hypothetical protein